MYLSEIVLDLCRLYLKKAEVVDVPEPTRCSMVIVETGEKLSGVRQSQLETVVPKEERRCALPSEPANVWNAVF